MEHKLTEIRNLDVALIVQEQILWLEVPIHSLLAVQVVKGQDHTGRVEPRSGLFEEAPPS
jgi:hypothetical protein